MRHAPPALHHALVLLLVLALAGCHEAVGEASGATGSEPASHQRMLVELAAMARENPYETVFGSFRTPRGPGYAGADYDRWSELLSGAYQDSVMARESQAIERLTEAYAMLDELRDVLPERWSRYTIYRLGLAWLRQGETVNCTAGRSSRACIVPIEGDGLHSQEEGSRKALVYFGELLLGCKEPSPDCLSTKWLYNLAAMTVGDYPDGVPEAWRVPPEVFASDEPFPWFPNIAPALGLDGLNMSGGVIADDFDGDDALDLLVSNSLVSGQIEYYQNAGDGTFVARTHEANLEGIYGGLNLVQADYDNDGDVDALVLRGAWLDRHGRHLKSLLRNDGHGRFTDVTFDAGLGEARFPTQTGSWADYDNDGDLDLYIGNEIGPSPLFRNNGNGTFTDVAAAAGVADTRFPKGVVWGDYDGDRYPDLYVSQLNHPNLLFRNDGDGTFTEVAVEAGVERPLSSFATWFWDFDNDGNLDLYVTSYAGSRGALAYVVASYLGLEQGQELARLYRGDGHGGFRDVTREWHLGQLHLTMGSNFGDLDNDGRLDFYLATGYPDLEALMPNAMYRNTGTHFSDVTSAGGFGHLQKGHAIAFTDIDNDGDQDVFAQLGGAFPGDRYRDAMFENPGFGHHWITLQLVGTESNRSALGARIRVDIEEDGRARSIYRDVTSGGSFGASPLRQQIGIGRAERVKRLEVSWPTSDTTQVFEGLPVDRFMRVFEGRDEIVYFDPPRAGGRAG